MKKRTVILTAGLCALALLAGCGNEKAGNEKTDGQETSGADITLGEYKGMEISVEKAEVTDADVQTYVEQILAYYPAYETLDKKVVENGDFVNIDYEGLLDGVAFDGGTASDQVLEIGSGSFIDGFEEGLIGANVGDTLALDLTFPDPYQNNPDLAGKAVVFNVTVNKIVQKIDMTYEELTDEYVSTYLSSMGYDSVQALKDGIMENLNSTNEYYAQSNTRSAVLDKIVELCTVNELPEGLLDERVAEYKKQMEDMCTEQYGMTLAEYLEQQGTTEEEFNTQVVEYMKEKLEIEQILLAIADAEGIELDEEGYQEFVSNVMANDSFETEEDLYTEYGEDYIKDSYICNKAVDMLVENAVVNYTAPAENTETGDTTDDAETEAAAEGTETEDTTNGED